MIMELMALAERLFTEFPKYPTINSTYWRAE